MVCKLTNEGVSLKYAAAASSHASAQAHHSSSHLQVPQFNAFMFLENKTQIGKVDEIFGSIKDVVRNSCHLNRARAMRRRAHKAACRSSSPSSHRTASWPRPTAQGTSSTLTQVAC